MTDYKKIINDLLALAFQKGASDVHISPAHYPILRVHGILVPLSEMGVLSSEATRGIVDFLVGDERKEYFEKHKDTDFTYELQENIRFRVNAYYTKGNVAAVLHTVPQEIKGLTDLKLPQTLEIFTKLSQGFILVVGATGQGKSTTLASLIQIINTTRATKIITIEDPIEYVFSSDRSVIDQREVGSDTPSFDDAIRSGLRENIDVMMIGEMRDLETIKAGVTAAETGHLVFSTLHTNSASQTIDRVINSFPGDQQNQIRAQLAESISGVVAQRLVPGLKGGLVPAVEVMVATPAVRNIIRSNELSQLNIVIDTGGESGMVSFNRSLSNLVREGAISEENAYSYSPDPKNLKSVMK